MRLLRLAATAAALTAVAAAALPAQSRPPARDDRGSDRDVTIYRNDGAGPLRIINGRMAADADRAVLGIGTGSGGDRDTLGLLVTTITPNGPAEKAGLEEGSRIAAINGVNLRLAPADAGEPDMRGMTSRRLTRELGKVRPGAEVELRVWQNGQYRNVRVRTTAADSLGGRRLTMSRSREDRDRDREARQRERDERPVLGIELQSSGNRRDTLGVLVTRVAEGGPAEKAGMVEGDRVAAVNGVDLRVAREDAGDAWVTNAKSNRFSREVAKLRPGQAVELRVWSGGQYKNVRVTAGRAGDVYKEGRQSFFFRDAAFEDGWMAPPLAPLPPTPPLPPLAPSFNDWHFELPGVAIDVDREAVGRKVDEAMRRASDALARSETTINRSLRGTYRM